MKLDDLLPVQDEHFNSEVFPVNANQQEMNKARLDHQRMQPNIKSLDVSHWAKNVPQMVRDDQTSARDLPSNGFYNEPSISNEETRINKQSTTRLSQKFNNRRK